jgi:hypothetical protein
MAEKDGLAAFDFGSTSEGLYLKSFPAKIRVLTTDPIVHIDKYGNTRFAFVVWNQDLKKAQILDRGSSIASEIAKLHLDEDWGANIQKLDIKITSTGEGKETRYSVNPLPQSKDLTNEEILKVKEIDLSKIENGVRMSDINSGEKKLSQVNALEEAGEIVVTDFPEGQRVSLDEIPF